MRSVLKYYSEFENPLLTFRDKQKTLIEQQETERLARIQQDSSVLKRWTPNFFKKPF